MSSDKQDDNSEDQMISETDLVSNDIAYPKLDQQGIVYVLQRTGNQQNNICKVGFTAVSGAARAKAYTDGGWVVFSEERMPIWLAKLTEREAHKQLKQYWIDPSITGGSATEIFNCDPETAEIAVSVSKDECLFNAFGGIGLNLTQWFSLLQRLSDQKMLPDGEGINFHEVTNYLHKRIQSFEPKSSGPSINIDTSNTEKEALLMLKRSLRNNNELASELAELRTRYNRLLTQKKLK